MDEYLESINMAARLLAAADGLEPSEPSHLVMNELDLRGLLTAAGLGSDSIDEAVHHAFQAGWFACAVAGGLAACTALGMTPRRPLARVEESAAVWAPA